MKAKYSILVLSVLLTLSACHTPTREAKRMVARAERLMDSLPDSAVRLIDSVLRMEAYLSERERMDMALLQAEALFGGRDVSRNVSDDILDDFGDVSGNVSTSPELERAAAYYADKKQYSKAAHAALYSGFVQQHYNEKDAAMQSFKDAERYGDLAGDSLCMARAEYRIGKMLFSNYMEKEAIYLLKSADKNFGTCFTEKALTQNMMAAAYIVVKQFDSAELCLRQSLAFAEQSRSAMAKKKALNNYAVFYRLQGNYAQAIASLRQIADEPNLTNTEKMLLYLNFGNSFAASGATDSATVCYQHVVELLPIADIKDETKVSAYGALSRFAESQGDISLALLYRKEYENLVNEVQRIVEQKNIYRIQQQYDYETLQNTMNRKIIRRHQIIVIISILLLVLAVLLAIVQYRQKQLLKAEEEMKLQIDTMKQELQQSVKSSVLEQEVNARLQLILTAIRISKRTEDPQCVWKPLVSQVMSNSVTTFDASRTIIEMAYPDLYAILREQHPELSETEVKICMLSFTELSNSEMAELLGLSLNTVNQNRSTLRKKLNLKPTNKMKEQLRSTFSN